MSGVLLVTNTPGVNVPLNVFTVVNEDTILYNGTYYQGITDIHFPDGTHKTCADLIQNSGSASSNASALKACVKVEGIDPKNGRHVFSAYSSNSSQTAKNNTTLVPGGLWVEVFDFLGDETTNWVLQLWSSLGANWQTLFSTRWLGFSISYGVKETRSYVMTQVNDFLEESVPCSPSQMDVTHMHDVQLTGAFIPPTPGLLPGATVPPGVYNGSYYVPIRSFKLYRANITSAGSFVYQRVPVDPVSIDFVNGNAGTVPHLSPRLGVIPHAVYVGFQQSSFGFFITPFGYTFTDTSNPEDLLESLPSVDWDAPPLDLVGLTAWHNGMMVAWRHSRPNELYFSEPYRPFTFPAKYIKSLPRKIVGMRADENSLVIITDGEPYVLHGAHPSNVSTEKLQTTQSGMKPLPTAQGWQNPSRSITNTPVGVLYASREGLIVISGGRAKTLFRELFTRDEWLRRYATYTDNFGRQVPCLDKLRLAYYDGQVVGYFEGLQINGFIIGLNDGQFTEFAPPIPMSADFVLPNTDSMYVVVGSNILRFCDESQPRMTCSYWTREFTVSNPMNAGVLQVFGSGQIRAVVFARGQMVSDTTLTLTGGPTIVRLPSGYKAHRFSVYFDLYQDAHITEVYVAQTPLELKGA